MLHVNAEAQTPTLGWVRYELALGVLATVRSEFERERVDFLAVKGIVLASLLYKDPAERPLRDIDLRVRPRDLYKVTRIARRNRWPLHFSSRQLGAFSFTIGSMLVDVEASVGPLGLCGLTIERIFERSRVRTLGSTWSTEPDVVDHAILLLVNAFKDKLVLCPAWSVRDLGAIVEHPEFDLGTFLARVDESRLHTIAWITADWLAVRWPVWGKLRDRLGTVPRRRYAALFNQSVRSNPEGLPARVLARVGSDDRTLQACALAAGVAGSVASRAMTTIRR